MSRAHDKNETEKSAWRRASFSTKHRYQINKIQWGAASPHLFSNTSFLVVD